MKGVVLTIKLSCSLKMLQLQQEESDSDSSVAQESLYRTGDKGGKTVRNLYLKGIFFYAQMIYDLGNSSKQHSNVE